MKASKLIVEVQAMINKHGDCEIGVCAGEGTNTSTVYVNFSEAPKGTAGAPEGWRIIEVACEGD